MTIDKPDARPHFRKVAKVEIYTRAWCPYCTRAMKLLCAKGVTPHEHDISLGGPKRSEMLERAGGRTSVPQIFIDDQHVGGSDDLATLEREGRLDALLGR